MHRELRHPNAAAFVSTWVTDGKDRGRIASMILSYKDEHLSPLSPSTCERASIASDWNQLLERDIQERR
jgi:hypothetical protein